MSAVTALMQEHRLGQYAGASANHSAENARTRHKKDDIATLLQIPGMNAFTVWKKTAHERHKLIKEVMTRKGKNAAFRLRMQLFFLSRS